MFTPSTLQQWLAEQAVPLFLVGFAVMMGVFLLYLSAVARRSGIARSRSGCTEDTFSDEMAAYGYDPEIARMTYQALQEQPGIDFPLQPTDDLECDLGLDPDEVDRVVWQLLETASREHAPGLQPAPIMTVAHLVRHIQTAPTRYRRLHIA